MPYAYRGAPDFLPPHGMALSHGGGRIPGAPFPHWDARGYGLHHFGALPFLNPGFGAMNPRIVRDGDWRRFQQNYLFPQAYRMLGGGGYSGLYGGGGMMPYGGFRRPRGRGRYLGYGVRGLDGRRWGGPGGMGLVSARSPPLHVRRFPRRGYPHFIEDPMDMHDAYDIFDAEEADSWYDELDDEEYGPYPGMWSNGMGFGYS